MIPNQLTVPVANSRGESYGLPLSLWRSVLPVRKIRVFTIRLNFSLEAGVLFLYRTPFCFSHYVFEPRVHSARLMY